MPIPLFESWFRYAVGIALVLGVLLESAVAKAEKVPSLFNASVPVDSQSDADRNRGFRAALEQVLIKVSGLESEILSGKIADKFPSPLGLVQSYSYRETSNVQAAPVIPQTATEVSGDTSRPGLSRFLLDVVFASALIEQQMLRLQLPIWGDTRPSVLLWVLVEQQGERQLIGNGDLFGLSDLLMQDAQRRALPVFLPSADLQDLVAINMSNLSALKIDSVQEANLRYQPDANVLLRVVHAGSERWNADWLISVKQETASGKIRDVSLTSVVSAMGAELASYLSSRYAVRNALDDRDVVAGANTDLLLEIDRINSFEDFIALQHHLENLPPLSSVVIERIEGSRVFCRAKLDGTRQQLFEYVELSGLMQAKPNQETLNQPPSMSLEIQKIVQAKGQAEPERFDWRGDPSGR